MTAYIEVVTAYRARCPECDEIGACYTDHADAVFDAEDHNMERHGFPVVRRGS